MEYQICLKIRKEIETMKHINKNILEEYTLMRLTEDEEFEIQEHLANCEECSDYVNQLRLISQNNQRLHEELAAQK